MKPIDVVEVVAVVAATAASWLFRHHLLPLAASMKEVALLRRLVLVIIVPSRALTPIS